MTETAVTGMCLRSRDLASMQERRVAQAPSTSGPVDVRSSLNNFTPGLAWTPTPGVFFRLPKDFIASISSNLLRLAP